MVLPPSPPPPPLYHHQSGGGGKITLIWGIFWHQPENFDTSTACDKYLKDGFPIRDCHCILLWPYSDACLWRTDVPTHVHKILSPRDKYVQSKQSRRKYDKKVAQMRGEWQSHPKHIAKNNRKVGIAHNKKHFKYICKFSTLNDLKHFEWIFAVDTTRTICGQKTLKAWKTWPPMKLL